MRWHFVAISAFAGLCALITAGLLVQVQDRAEIARSKRPVDQCQDCKDAYKRITYAED